MTHTLEKPSATSAGLMNASMLVYLFWLLLPAVQTTGHAVTGAAAVALFGAGVLLDGTWLRAHGWRTLLRAACAALMPVILRVFLARGGGKRRRLLCAAGHVLVPGGLCGLCARAGRQPPVALDSPAPAGRDHRDHAHHPSAG